jgi:hypothetical protein
LATTQQRRTTERPITERPITERPITERRTNQRRTNQRRTTERPIDHRRSDDLLGRTLERSRRTRRENVADDSPPDGADRSALSQRHSNLSDKPIGLERSGGHR